MSEEIQKPKKQYIPKNSAGSDVGWGTLAEGKKEAPQGDGEKQPFRFEYVKLEENKRKKLRLIGKPYKYYSWFTPIVAVSPGFEDDECWKAGNQPKERYIIFCIDREDGKIKLFDSGRKVFSAFGEYFEATGKDPGTQNGPDWIVSFTVPSIKKDGRTIKDKRSTKYSVVRDESAPFTAEEQEMIKKELIDPATNAFVDMKKIKKSTTKEKIAELFKESKTCKEGDPIPGSKIWWENKKRKGQPNTVNDDGDTSSAPSQHREEARTASSTPTTGAGKADGAGAYTDMFGATEEGENTSF